jgi:hypothetical protein
MLWVSYFPQKLALIVMLGTRCNKGFKENLVSFVKEKIPTTER